MVEPLRDFIQSVTRVLNVAGDEDAVISSVRSAMRNLVSSRDWLPAEFAEPAGTNYGQHLLYCDPLERFCVVSFVWNPGQITPVHDHTVWGVIGQLAGEEESQAYVPGPGGKLIPQGELEILRPGETCVVSPRDIDIHFVRNPSVSEKSIGIHAYGANIARVHRHVYDPITGRKSEFMSTYTNSRLPNIWR